MDQGWYVSVTVHPHSGRDVLVSHGPGRFEAWVRAKPIHGEATAAVTRLLAQTLKVPPGRLRLIKGWNRRHKVFRIIA
jgi:uncharacterized protein YggU (UPF0235/DUF167 family)